MSQRAKPAARHELMKESHCRSESVTEPTGVWGAALLNRVDHAPGCFATWRQWFLAQDRLSGTDRRQANWLMQNVRGEVGYDVDFRIFDKRLPIGRPSTESEVGREPLRRFLSPAVHGHETDLVGERSDMIDGVQGMSVRSSYPGRANYADSETWTPSHHHLHLYRVRRQPPKTTEPGGYCLTPATMTQLDESMPGCSVSADQPPLGPETSALISAGTGHRRENRRSRL